METTAGLTEVAVLRAAGRAGRALTVAATTSVVATKPAIKRGEENTTIPV